jgi:O-antigen/teichoic acid export membrane protein
MKKIHGLLGIKSFRTKNIFKHVSSSIIFQIGSMIANFLIVPLSINYLEAEKFGVWLTITSFVSWFSFFDIGLGNGLRNKLTESITKNNIEKAKGYVSTAYFTLTLISTSIIVLFFFINQFIEWDRIFNTSSVSDNDLSLLLLLVFTFFSIQLVTKLIVSVFQAHQFHSINNYFQFLVQVISLLVVWVLTKLEGNSLLIFGVLYSFVPVLILLYLNLYSFNYKYEKIKPKLSYFKKEYLSDITSLGFKFFVIQIAVIVLYSTDNFIITTLFGPEEVVPYNIAFKYFSIIIIVFSTVVSPFWSSFTEAYTLNEIDWIKKSVNNIQKIWIFFLLMIIVMVLFSDWFYDFWIGDSVYVPYVLSLSMALYVSITTFNMVYVDFLNGIGKIKLQLFTAIFSMLINIPLSIYFAKYLELGVVGVILATCFCSLYSAVLKPIQYYKIINNKAKGIWNK